MNSHPTKFEVVATERLLTVSATGRLSAAALVEFVATFYPEFRGDRILWDLSGADVSGVDLEEFGTIAAAVQAATPAGLQRRTAYVVGSGTTYLRIWKYLNEATLAGIPVEYHAFTSLAEARDWLNSAR